MDWSVDALKTASGASGTDMNEDYMDEDDEEEDDGDENEQMEMEVSDNVRKVSLFFMKENLL